MKISLTVQILISTYIVITFVVNWMIAREFEKKKGGGTLLDVVIVNLASICWPALLVSYAIFKVENWRTKTSFGEFICR